MELKFLDSISGKLIFALASRQGMMTIGRSSGCDVVIPGCYSTVSSHHATIRDTGNSIEITDGDGHKPSTNGLFINGIKQASGSWTAVNPGTTIYLGKPGHAESILLEIGPPVRSAESGGDTPHGAGRAPRSITPLAGLGLKGTQNHAPERHWGSSVSDAMQRRLILIDQYLAQGYSLQKGLGAFPFFIGSGGRKHQISILKNPAGFSWIAFFFPFAVCAQIREWSFFYVISIVETISTLIAVVTGHDGGAAVGTAISIMYGIYFPYLRWIALDRNIPENPVGLSILLGIALTVLAALPSFAITYYSAIG